MNLDCSNQTLLRLALSLSQIGRNFNWGGVERSVNMARAVQCLKHTGEKAIEMQRKMWAEIRRRPGNKYIWKIVCHPHAICWKVLDSICRLLQDTTKYLHAHASRAKVVQSIAVPRLEQHSPTKHIFASHIFNEADFCFKHLSECVSNNDNSSCPTEPTSF